MHQTEMSLDTRLAINRMEKVVSVCLPWFFVTMQTSNRASNCKKTETVHDRLLNKFNRE